MKKIPIVMQYDSKSYEKGYNKALEDVKQFIKNLKYRLNTLLIQKNTLFGQALLTRKDYGKTPEHCFDGFFRDMQKGMKEEIDKLAGEELLKEQKK